MTREEVISKVNAFLTDDFEIEEALLQEGNLITDEIGIDSLDMVDIIVRVNEEFGFKLEKAEIAKVKTLGEFYDLLMQKIA